MGQTEDLILHADEVSAELQNFTAICEAITRSDADHAVLDNGIFRDFVQRDRPSTESHKVEHSEDQCTVIVWNCCEQSLVRHVQI